MTLARLGRDMQIYRGTSGGAVIAAFTTRMAADWYVQGRRRDGESVWIDAVELTATEEELTWWATPVGHSP